MKKSFIWVLGLLLVVSACTSNAAGGAYVGGQFGHVIGSAIGGIAGGWRGHHTGALIGTVGGVVAGAAIGAAIDNAQEKKYEERARARENERYQSDDSGFDPEGRGDDRIMIEPEEAPLNIRNAMITEMQHDGVLTRGEECTVMFEIMNTSDHPIYDIQPFVEDGKLQILLNDVDRFLNVLSTGMATGEYVTALQTGLAEMQDIVVSLE